MIDAAINGGPLEGFVPITPLGASEVIGPFVKPKAASIFVRRQPEDGEPGAVDLGAEPPNGLVEQAWAYICEQLPGLNRSYLSALIYARFVAQRAIGTPPIVAVTGLTGSAKTATVHLAGGMVGARAVAIGLDSPDDTLRRIGLVLEEGAGFVLIDEVGRVEKVYAKLEPILRANSDTQFRAKYANERLVRVTAPIILAGSTLPPAIVHSPELSRRGVGYRLTGAERVWSLMNPESGIREDLKDVRRIAALRERLDIITASVWWRVRDDIERRRDWRDVLMQDFEAVPLLELDIIDGNSDGRDEIIRKLYETYRTAKETDLSGGERWSGWLQATSGSPEGDLLDELIDLDADKSALIAQCSELERLNLIPVLGFDKPQLQMLVRRRSAVFMVKFVQVGVPKGRGTKRNEMPPIANLKSEVRI